MFSGAEYKFRNEAMNERNTLENKTKSSAAHEHKNGRAGPLVGSKKVTFLASCVRVHPHLALTVSCNET